jgi:hypothetical protein
MTEKPPDSGRADAGRMEAQRGRLGFHRWIREATTTFRKAGLKGVLSTYGIKLLAAFVLFYLVRDVALYIVLPYLAARGLLSLWK